MYETQHQAAVAVGNSSSRKRHRSPECYDIGVSYLKEGVTFGEVVDEMEKPLLASGGWHVHPLIHSINPVWSDRVLRPIPFCRIPARNWLKRMSLHLEPNCAFGYHLEPWR